MEILKPAFPSPAATNPSLRRLRRRTLTRARASVRPPPPGYDFRSEVLFNSRAAIARSHPELLDLAEDGSLVLIERSQFGPVPAWRSEFAEPEAVWLLGTSHISPDSPADVARVVRALKPDSVVVELCRSRAGIMYAATTSDGEAGPQLGPNMFSLSGAGFFGAVSRSIDLGGQSALALRLLFAAFSSKISSHVKRPFGEEFCAARKASEAVGAQIVLGDRPIEITLERAWNSLNLSDKISLVIKLIQGITSSSFDESMTNLKEPSTGGGSFQLYEQLSSSYPSLLMSLLHERDTYLAWSLKRSKAVNNSKRVVGIIGKGHMNGVIYALVSDLGNLRFHDLVGKRRGRAASRGWIATLLQNLFRETIIGILLWVLFEFVKDGGSWVREFVP